MSKTRKDKQRNFRDFLAVDAHFRRSAGEMKDRKLDKRLSRSRNRQLERYYIEMYNDEEFDEM